MFHRVAVLLIACALLAPQASHAFYIHLHGIVTEYFSGDAMKGVQVRLVKDSVDRETVITSSNGKYELYLERGYDYQVWFHRSDLVTKHVLIDARKVPLFPDVPFFDMDLQMTMFAWIDGYELGLYMEPVARAEYKQSVRNLSWDVEYTKDFQSRSQRAMVHYEREVADRQRKAARKGAAAKRTRRKRVIDF
ncbi:MAG: hypothetical protein KF797_01150 [Flavobacteriales bacterium]|nr:hypothetical protein [Flavobacteriales bacterium]